MCNPHCVGTFDYLPCLHTLDGEAVSTVMGNAPIVRSEGESVSGGDPLAGYSLGTAQMRPTTRSSKLLPSA